MKRVHFPAGLAQLDGWIEEERRSYFELIRHEAEEHGRILPRDHPKGWKEWWVLREIVRPPVTDHVFGANFVAEQMDSGSGGPDFLLTRADDSIAIDVTEATTQEDRIAIKKGRLVDEAYSVGDLGGRGKGGWSGDYSEEQVAADIAEAIERKKNHRYGSRAALLVYVNSNLSVDVSELACRLSPLQPNVPFDFILIIIATNRPLIQISHSGVLILA